MSEWQTPISLIIVAGAIAVLLNRVGRWWYGDPSKQAGCSGCPSKSNTPGDRVKELPLIHLGSKDR